MISLDQFATKSAAYTVALVFNATDIGYSVHGYEVPEPDAEPLSGLKCWPAVFAYPQTALMSHWPAVVSLIMDSASALQKSAREPLHHVDRMTSATYFVAQVDDRVFLVSIYTGAKRADDKQVSSFYSFMTQALRSNSVFAALKHR